VTWRSVQLWLLPEDLAAKEGQRCCIKGRCRDNIFVERLWRSLKYENIYLKAYEDLRELRAGLASWFRFYNHEGRASGARVSDADERLTGKAGAFGEPRSGGTTGVAQDGCRRRRLVQHPRR